MPRASNLGQRRYSAWLVTNGRRQFSRSSNILLRGARASCHSRSSALNSITNDSGGSSACECALIASRAPRRRGTSGRQPRSPRCAQAPSLSPAAGQVQMVMACGDLLGELRAEQAEDDTLRQGNHQSCCYVGDRCYLRKSDAPYSVRNRRGYPGRRSAQSLCASTCPPSFPGWNIPPPPQRQRQTNDHHREEDQA
jgi:hypothetical protein